jgi:hypothetical protein
MRRSSDVWASDTSVSKPEPAASDQPALVDLGGFAMTAGGLAHNLTASDVEDIFTPMYAPEGWVPDA